MKLAIDDVWASPAPLTATAEAGPREDDIRLALARIVVHPLFAKSIKLQRFLTYVVEETIAGRAARLKAYNIATIALGRPDSFDPSQDPIVRVEASRLRRALTAYYAGDGVSDPVKILLNAGSYQPAFVAGTVDGIEAETRVPDAPIVQGMSRRERILLGMIVLLFLVTLCNTIMLTMSVSKLDELERAIGHGVNTVSQFEGP